MELTDLDRFMQELRKDGRSLADIDSKVFRSSTYRALIQPFLEVPKEAVSILRPYLDSYASIYNVSRMAKASIGGYT